MLHYVPTTLKDGNAMKKRERVKRKENIIFFPGLEKRLTDRGLESLQNKKFTEAINFLEEARALSPDDHDILIGLVLAYFEASSYQKAKVLANEMLLKGIGDYFHLVDLYLSILIQLHEYEEIVITVEALLEEKEIPPEKHDHFSTILQFSKRMAEQEPPSQDESLPEEENIKGLNLFSLHSLNEQMLAVSSLAEKNIRPYISEITDFLTAETGHPFLKTMLLILLKEQEYEKEIAVQKFGMESNVIPTLLPEIKFQPRMQEIKTLLKNCLEQSNPVLFENIIGMVERIFFISYPFELEPKNSEAWAAAFQFLVLDYMGLTPNMDELLDEYEATVEEIEHAQFKIRELEEISYPNI
jgi:tetratricopeptide (TPR) repeat protein